MASIIRDSRREVCIFRWTCRGPLVLRPREVQMSREELTALIGTRVSALTWSVVAQVVTAVLLNRPIVSRVIRPFRPPKVDRIVTGTVSIATRCSSPLRSWRLRCCTCTTGHPWNSSIVVIIVDRVRVSVAV